ncbi:MAG: hypothetical protein ACK55I_26400, partial [bacterium]
VDGEPEVAVVDVVGVIGVAEGDGEVPARADDVLHVDVLSVVRSPARQRFAIDVDPDADIDRAGILGSVLG